MIIPVHDRTRIEATAEYRQVATTTMVILLAFAMSALTMGGVLFFLSQQDFKIIPGMAHLRNPLLGIAVVLTLVLIAASYQIASSKISTRISSSDDGNDEPNQAHGANYKGGMNPELGILIVSLAVLEAPLVLAFVGVMTFGFSLDTYAIAAGVFLFGLGVLAVRIRPLILETTLQRLFRRESGKSLSNQNL